MLFYGGYVRAYDVLFFFLNNTLDRDHSTARTKEREMKSKTNFRQDLNSLPAPQSSVFHGYYINHFDHGSFDD